MRAQRFAAILGSLFIASFAQAKYEAHEWGTFTSLVGSNGITQDGMYHEDEALPDFVYRFGETQSDRHKAPPRLPQPPCHGKGCFDQSVFAKNVITQKMETPVIYFYGDQSEHLSVNVKFPEGVISESFPGPVATFPAKSDDPVIANGNTTFEVNISPRTTGTLPPVSRDNIYSHAREVASNIVSSVATNDQTQVENEKFIFYRGLGRFQPKLNISSSEGALSIRSERELPIAFLVHVNSSGDGQLLSVLGKNEATLSSARISELQDHSAIHAGIYRGSEAKSRMINALVSQGLFADEAQAMINTWEHGYLRVPGLRLLYILPRSEVDQVLPLKMTPAPTRLTRVFVGRIEVLLDTVEQKIVTDVLQQGAYFRVNSLGRFAEPMLRRASEVYERKFAASSPGKQSLFEQLIQRASNSETDGVSSSIQ